MTISFAAVNQHTVSNHQSKQAVNFSNLEETKTEELEIAAVAIESYQQCHYDYINVKSVLVSKVNLNNNKTSSYYVLIEQHKPDKTI